MRAADSKHCRYRCISITRPADLHLRRMKFLIEVGSTSDGEGGFHVGVTAFLWRPEDLKRAVSRVPTIQMDKPSIQSSLVARKIGESQLLVLKSKTASYHGLSNWNGVHPDYGHRRSSPDLFQSYINSLKLGWTSIPCSLRRLQLAHRLACSGSGHLQQSCQHWAKLCTTVSPAWMPYRTGDKSSGHRQRYSGNVRLVANFDISRLYGSIVDVRGSEPGSSTRNRLPTSSFRISDGEIHDNGQFTATLTGMDSDASVPDKDSVRGVMGQILGEFYGPNGEELGGTVTAYRDLAGDTNDLTFHGHIRGEKFGPTVDLAADALVAGIDRGIRANRSELLTDDGMARIERTAGGWTVTVDGQTVALDDSDYGALSSIPSIYWKDLGNARSAGLWTNAGGFGQIRGSITST